MGCTRSVELYQVLVEVGRMGLRWVSDRCSLVLVTNASVVRSLQGLDPSTRIRRFRAPQFRCILFVGVLMWEIFSCGKMPYGRLKNTEVVERVQRGIILEKPKACVKEIYDVSTVAEPISTRLHEISVDTLILGVCSQIMCNCWAPCAEDRPSFRALKEQLHIVSQVRCYFCDRMTAWAAQCKNFFSHKNRLNLFLPWARDPSPWIFWSVLRLQFIHVLWWISGKGAWGTFRSLFQSSSCLIYETY